MAYVTQTQLVDNLKFRAVIQPSDPFTDAQLTELIQDAVAKHNPAYTVSDVSSNVPAPEKVPVVYLAWREVCLVRASRYACDTNLSGAHGFASDRNSPFEKNMKLADDLWDLYLEACDALGLEVNAGSNSDANKVVVSDVTVTDPDTSAQIPHQIAPPPPGITLAFADPVPKVNADGTLTLNFSYKPFVDFAGVTLFHDDSELPILEPWNYASTSGIPQIRNDLTGIPLNNSTQRSVKLEGLPSVGPFNLRFIAVLRNVNGLCSYSEELVIVL